MERLINDAVQKGATLRTGGERIGNKGNFLRPTGLIDGRWESISILNSSHNP
jgi:succinate-semialdehyde dehydrogenase/glutarate-semialdehyde dehydrogenase